MYPQLKVIGRKGAVVPRANSYTRSFHSYNGPELSLVPLGKYGGSPGANTTRLISTAIYLVPADDHYPTRERTNGSDRREPRREISHGSPGRSYDAATEPSELHYDLRRVVTISK
jgi:hypothetical protein